MDARLKRLAHLLVTYSAGVRSGESVRLIGPAAAEPLLDLLHAEVGRQGAIPVLDAQRMDACIYVECGSAAPALSTTPPQAWITAMRGEPPSLKRCRGQSGSCAPALQSRWTATLFPSPEWQEPFFVAAFLNQPDPVHAWQSLSEKQRRLCEVLQSAREIRFWTPQGTDLTVHVAGRTWLNGDGHWNMPDGEVFTGPYEDGTAGVVQVSFPAWFEGRCVEGIRLCFRGGRVVEATAHEGQGTLERLLATDAGASILGEVALGCNYALTRHTGHALLDEKIGGTFHVALGASFLQSGGRNISAIHWDLVCDLRQGGRVEVDGRPLAA